MKNVGETLPPEILTRKIYICKKLFLKSLLTMSPAGSASDMESTQLLKSE